MEVKQVKRRRIKLSNNTGVIKLDQLGYINGSKILEKAAFRIAHEDVLVAVSYKIRAVFLRRFTAVIISMNNKNENELLRKYLYKWRINANPLKNISDEIKKLLKLLFLRYDNNLKSLLSKYLNRWRYKKMDPLKAINRVRKVGILIPSIVNKKIWNDKNRFFSRLRGKFIRDLDRDKNRQKLKNLFKKYFLCKINNFLNDLAKKKNIEKLIKTTTKEIIKNRENLLLNIIKKWRFLTFVSSLTKKKLELIYKNLHVSYIEMAEEIFRENSPINPDDLKNMGKYTKFSKFCDPNDYELMKEIGLDPNNCDNFFKKEEDTDNYIEKTLYKYDKIKKIYEEEKIYDSEYKPRKMSNISNNNGSNYDYNYSFRKNPFGYTMRKTMATECSDN